MLVPVRRRCTGVPKSSNLFVYLPCKDVACILVHILLKVLNQANPSHDPSNPSPPYIRLPSPYSPFLNINSAVAPSPGHPLLPMREGTYCPLPPFSFRPPSHIYIAAPPLWWEIASFSFFFSHGFVPSRTPAPAASARPPPPRSPAPCPSAPATPRATA